MAAAATWGDLLSGGGIIPVSALQLGKTAPAAPVEVEVKAAAPPSSLLEEEEEEEEALPCRIKLYARRGGTSGNPTEAGTEPGPGPGEYRLALDAEVLCRTKGRETLLGSELFLRHYRLAQRDAASAAAAAGGDPVDDGSDRDHDGDRNDEGDRRRLPEEPAAGGDDLAAYPLLVPPGGTLELRVVALPVADAAADAAAAGASFLLMSSPGAPAVDAANAAAVRGDGTLALRAGSSAILGYGRDPADPTAGGTVDEAQVLGAERPTVVDGTVYYDVLGPDDRSLAGYFAALAEGLRPRCRRELDTGLEDTVGSYGIMFDVSAAAAADEDGGPAAGAGAGAGDDLDDKLGEVEVYGMDLYIRNRVSSAFEVYVRKGEAEAEPEPEGDAGGQVAASAPGRRRYASYGLEAGQTLIAENWELVAGE